MPRLAGFSPYTLPLLFMLCTSVNTFSEEAPLTEPTILDEMVVTGQQSYYDKNATAATRLKLPILETPQSVFVINEDLIADQQAFRLDQVLQNDSSVQKANNFLGAYSSYQIRGFRLDNGANYLRDGRTFFHLAAPPVEILERVEVVKGPSSILYGTLAPGGLINMVPKRPQSETNRSVKATVGSDNLYHGVLDLGGPLTDEGAIRYRFNAVYENSDYFREFADGSDFNTERFIVYGALEWDMSDMTLLRINADYTDDDRPQDIGLLNLDARFTNIDTDVIISQPWTLYNSDVYNVDAELTHQFNAHFKVRAGLSYQDFKRDRYDNQFRGQPDANGDVQIRARRRVNRWDYTTYFADFISEFETGLLAHQLLIGAQYTDVGIDNNETSRNETFTNNIFKPVIVDDPGINTRVEKNLGSEDRKGVYLQDNIAFGKQWRLLMGGRYDDYESELRDTRNNSLLNAESADKFTPRVGLLFLPTDTLSFYGSYSESFEPNGAVGQQFDNAGEALDPTEGAQLEAGVKWEAIDGNLLATIAVFTIDRDNAPIEDSANNRLVQRGKQTHNGAEINLSGLVGRHLSLTGSATYLDAEFKQDDNPDIIGNTPAGVPELALSLAGEYAFLEGAVDGLSLQAGIFYESDRPVDDANSYDLDSYVRLDVGLKYILETSFSEQTWRFSVQNLTDEEYFKAESLSAINPERRREIRASLEVAF